MMTHGRCVTSICHDIGFLNSSDIPVQVQDLLCTLKVLDVPVAGTDQQLSAGEMSDFQDFPVLMTCTQRDYMGSFMLIL